MQTIKKSILCFSGFVLLLTLASCGDNKSDVQSGQVNKTDSAKNIKDNGFKMLQGHWVSLDYIEVVDKTKSPRYAFDSASYNIIGILIDTTDIEHDTLNAATYSLNEGGALPILLPQNKDGSFNLASYVKEEDVEKQTARVKIMGNDTLLFLDDFDKNGKLLHSNTYLHAFSNLKTKDTITQEGLQLILAQKLFAGKYKMGDKIVSFSKNGMMSWPDAKVNYKFFYIIFDYAYGFSDVDVVTFSNQRHFTNHRVDEEFAFKIVKDTITLYNFKSDENTTVADSTKEEDWDAFHHEGLGSVAYKLVKIKEK